MKIIEICVLSEKLKATCDYETWKSCYVWLLWLLRGISKWDTTLGRVLK
jgi:hypothetical protein